MSIDELADKLAITRTAVRQHLSALVDAGFIAKGERRVTRGRPVQSYRLTTLGMDLFPKQYSWFSELMLTAIRDEKGSEALRRWMEQLGEAVAESFENRVRGKTDEQRRQLLIDLMNDLAYQAEAGQVPRTIEASNCVYHSLAEQFPEVCAFDLALIGKLANGKVLHETCMVRGGNRCRFRISKK